MRDTINIALQGTALVVTRVWLQGRGFYGSNSPLDLAKQYTKGTITRLNSLFLYSRSFGLNSLDISVLVACPNLFEPRAMNTMEHGHLPCCHAATAWSTALVNPALFSWLFTLSRALPC